MVQATKNLEIAFLVSLDEKCFFLSMDVSFISNLVQHHIQTFND